jgi:hypothetical protein
MTVLVPRERIRRWLDNFVASHGATELTVADGHLRGQAEDGSWFDAAPPFDRSVDEPTVDALDVASTPPDDWGVLLVRKGGFAVARLAGDQIVESKVGQRHVQGRTKAGGQSQQRFARRRDNQARQAYEAAAEHAARILCRPLDALVCGGDRSAVDAVLTDPRLASFTQVRVEPWLAVPDPRRAVLDQAVADACSVAITVTDAS